jgi:hypothetical protein
MDISRDQLVSYAALMFAYQTADKNSTTKNIEQVRRELESFDRNVPENLRSEFPFVRCVRNTYAHEI